MVTNVRISNIDSREEEKRFYSAFDPFFFFTS